jgi:hypothetical protein
VPAGYVDSTFLKAQLAVLQTGQDLRCIDSRCLSNLLWALVK